MKVIGTFGNPRVLKVLTVAQFAGVEVTQEVVTWEQIKTKEFSAKQPLQKIPVLETPEGCIYESNAISRYLARKSTSLYGANDFQAAQIDQYIDLLSLEIEPAMFALMFPVIGIQELDQERNKKATTDFNGAIRIIENILKGRTYIVGDSITLVDVVYASSLNFLFRFYLDEKLRKGLPNLTKWYENIANLEQFKKIYGKPVLCQQQLPAYFSGEKKVEAPKVKKEQPKKQEQKPKKKSVDEDEDIVEKKGKNPLDNLPPSSFNLFDFKTLYVNHPDKKVALEEFYKQFDAEGYSIWLIHYDKYEGEGEKFYLTLNLMNGFLQRLDHFRKYSFGVMGVYGQEPDLQIRGLFVWRSTDKPFEITDHPQYEYHTFTKLDIKKEEDKSLISQYWTQMAQGDTVEGLENQDCKYFK